VCAHSGGGGLCASPSLWKGPLTPTLSPQSRRASRGLAYAIYFPHPMGRQGGKGEFRDMGVPLHQASNAARSKAGAEAIDEMGERGIIAGATESVLQEPVSHAPSLRKP